MSLKQLFHQKFQQMDHNYEHYRKFVFIFFREKIGFNLFSEAQPQIKKTMSNNRFDVFDIVQEKH